MPLFFLTVFFFFFVSAIPAHAKPLPQNFFGIMSQAAPSLEDTKRMSSGGIRSYRLPMSWDSVQGNAEAPFDWTWVDETMKNLSLAGIRALPIMMGTPAGFGENFKILPIHDEKQKEGWKRYLQEAIGRYGVRGSFWDQNPDIPRFPIRTWQIWNEANFMWFAKPVSSTEYYLLLKNSYQIIKKEDSGSRLMLSSLFARPKHGTGRRAVYFLKDLYMMGAQKYFQSTAIHPYSINTKEMAQILVQFRNVMNKYGDRKKPLHVTELGWGSGSKTAFDKGSLRGQASELARGYKYLIKKRKPLGIASVYWFSWKDLPSDIPACNFCYNSGLFFASDPLQPKPAWSAFRKIANR